MHAKALEINALSGLPDTNDSVAKRPQVEHFGLADALRATAILAVVAAHLVVDMNFLTRVKSIEFSIGYWGVDAFFVLSGFLLGRPYIDALLGRRPMPGAMLYARRRFLRIWPTYAVVVVLVAIVSRIHNGARAASLADVATHLLMIHNFFPKFVLGDADGPLWTMAVDAQFYVALPMIAWLTMRFAKRAPSRVRLVGGVIVACIALSLAWRLLAIVLFPSHLQDVPEMYVLQRGVIGMGLCFALGALCALFQATHVRVTRPAAIGILAAGVLLAFAVFTEPFWYPMQAALYASTVLDLLGASSVVCIIFGISQVQSASFSRIVESKPVALVAANAYALYLVHTPVKFFVHVEIVKLHFHFGTLRYSLALLVAFAAIAPVVAWLLHTFVEQPFLTLKERSRETVVVP